MTLHYRSGYCSSPDCPHNGKEILLVNASRKLCNDCNKKRLQSGKPPKKYALKKRAYVKWKKQKPIKRTPIKKKFPAATGEGKMFLEIWAIRPHICINCKIPLGDEPRTFYFSHRIPKSRGEIYRLDPSDIDILCWDCHTARDQGTKEQYNQRTRM